MHTAVAMIPARSGSSRVPGKNIRPLGDHPLIAYTIAAARTAEVFDAVVVSTDDEETAEVARRYGAEVPAASPAPSARLTSRPPKGAIKCSVALGERVDVTGGWEPMASHWLGGARGVATR